MTLQVATMLSLPARHCRVPAVDFRQSRETAEALNPAYSGFGMGEKRRLESSCTAVVLGFAAFQVLRLYSVAKKSGSFLLCYKIRAGKDAVLECTCLYRSCAVSLSN